MSTNEWKTCKPGDKVQCVQLHYTHEDNHQYLEIGKVYTFLRWSRNWPGAFILKEVEDLNHNSSLFYIKDFEIVDNNPSDAWDRAMKGV